MDSLEKRRNTYEKLNYYDLITLCIKRKDKIDELKKENERLLKKSYKDDVIITKAIEYMNNYIKVEESNEPVKIEFKVVRNILQGSDKYE